MPEEKDLAVAMVAKRQGLITQEQLTEALRAAGREPGKELLGILVERGYLTQKKADALLAAFNSDSSAVTMVGPAVRPPEGPPAARTPPPPVRSPAGTPPPARLPTPRAGSPIKPSTPARAMPAPGKAGAGAGLRLGKPAPGVEISAPTGDTRTAAGANGRLGPYTLFRILGSGGMGVVYEAQHDSLPRKVALKCLPASLAADPAAVERFHREASAASKLNHPSLVPVFDVGQEGTTQYIAMEYIEGKNLEELVEAKALPLPDAVKAVRDVALGLHFAHQQGILHRDVKPSNIIRTPAGRSVLTDFGLALDASLNSLTASGAVVGTAAFMSPEQASGERKTLDARTDVYSLGATLYFLAAGRNPFQGASFEAILAQVLFNEPDPPRKVRRRIPQDLETVILKAMEKEPERRYRNAQQLADDLDHYLAGEPILARPVSTVALLARRARRHPRVVTGAALGLVVLLAGGAYAWHAISAAEKERQIEHERAEAEKRRRDEEARKKEEAQKQKDAVEHAAREAENEARSMATRATVIKAQDHTGAIKTMDEAIAKAPNLVELYLQRGRLYREVGQWGKAIKDFTTATEKDPKAVEAYAERGVTYYLMGDELKVLGDLQTVLKMEPNHTFADIGRGCMSYLMGKREDAIGHLDKALKKDPANAMALAIRGAALVEMGREEPGLKDLEAALALDPQNVTALTARAIWRLDHNKIAEAFSDANTAVGVFPSSGWAWCVRGRARLHLGQYKDAIDDLEKAIRLHGMHTAGYVDLAQAYYFTGKVEAAEKMATRALEQHADRRPSFWVRGMARTELKNVAGAVEDLGAVEKGAPAGGNDSFSPFLAMLRAQVALLQGDVKRAHQALQPFEARETRSFLLALVHARVLAAEHHDAEALQEFQEVLRASPTAEELIRADLAALKK